MRLVVSAGDPSGDVRAGEVLKELSGMCQLSVSGLGGDSIAAAGGKVIHHLRDYSVMGFAEVFSSLRKISRLRRAMREHILRTSPDAVLLVDYPGFNIPLARWARRNGFRVIYYISPQIWAWGRGRIRKIRRCVDLMITLFDFEVDFYKDHGVRAVCAGHPLVDTVPRPIVSEPGRRLALLPGSREQEVRLLLPHMLGAFSILRERGSVQICSVSRSPSLPGSLYDHAAEMEGVVLENTLGNTLAEASAAVVCSGTATLETAMWGVPMVITYRTSGFTYLLARLLVRGVRRIGMANIVVSGRDDVAEELIQGEVTPETIADAVEPLLGHSTARSESLNALGYVRDALGLPGAAARAAELILSECTDGKA